MNRRTLALRREALTGLTSDDLHGLAAGGTTETYPSCPGVGGSCFEVRCYTPIVAISASLAPTCQQSICAPCPTD